MRDVTRLKRNHESGTYKFLLTIQTTLRLALHHMMDVAVWTICQDQYEYHTIQKAETPVWDILAWSMQMKVETSDWNNTE